MEEQNTNLAPNSGSQPSMDERTMSQVLAHCLIKVDAIYDTLQQVVKWVNPEPEWLTVKEAAVMLNTAEANIRNWGREGKLEYEMKNGKDRKVSLRSVKKILAQRL